MDQRSSGKAGEDFLGLEGKKREREKIDSDVAMKRQLSVFPNFYQAVFYYVLWVTCDVT
jgi:hypothetical protein